MGTHPNIGHDRFPAQAEREGMRVGDPARVCFDYDASRLHDATIVRNDAEEPYVMLLQLHDGRVVLSTECMWQPAP